jgi:protein SCO1/2
MACTPADKPAAEGGVVSSGMPTAKQNCGNRSSDAIGGPFHLTAHNGSPTTEESFRGRKSFVFFGFTHCPDVCPITLFNIGKAISLLPPGKQAPRTVFISVDPARDTPEAISQYIQSNGFPKDIVGLTGTLDELEQTVTGFKTQFSRDEDADSAAGYLVSHSSILYLMDENWKLQTFFTDGTPPQEIADCLASL